MFRWKIKAAAQGLHVPFDNCRKQIGFFKELTGFGLFKRLMSVQAEGKWILLLKNEFSLHCKNKKNNPETISSLTSF